MSPEQARGSKVDHRTDIYSLGVVLYELLAGRVPFEGDTSMDVILKHINEPPPPIENISAELQSVIDKTLTKDPNDRYQDCRHLTADFFEAVGMHGEAETIHSARIRTPRPLAVPNQKKSGVSAFWIGSGLFVCACLGFLAFSGLGFTAITLFPSATAQTTPTPIKTSASGSGANPGDPTQGVLRFQDGTSTLDQITISAALVAPADGTQYEAWLISDSSELRRSLGLLAPNTYGQYTLSYVDPQSRNLLSEFNRMEITLEPNPDSSPNPSDNVAYSSEIPAGSLTHIRHLLVRFDSTPNQIGLTEGLVNTSTLIKETADAMLAAFETGDMAIARSNAEAIINLIAGKQAINQYQDWDGNRKINDPGDGFGLLLNGDQAGYIGNTIDHAKLSAEAPDSTPEIRMHSEHVAICTQNVEAWATQLRDVAISIAQSESSQILEFDVRYAATLANQILDGIDLNGNESIDPIQGEGGAITAFEHADYMSDMPILPGEKQVPASDQ